MNITNERKKALRDEKNFIKPILKMLQDNGGELSLSGIDTKIVNYTDFTEDEIKCTILSDKGNHYTPYYFGRNFALKNLQLAGFLNYSRNNPVKLTQLGLNADVEKLDLDADIYSKTLPYWDKKKKERRERKKKEQQSQKILDNDTMDKQDNPFEADTAWRTEILNRVKALEPSKFESFSRGLLNRMGFEIDPVKGIPVSNDGGIDGFAYCLDAQSLKTSRVVIQCKRFIDSPVGSHDINNLRGAIDTHRADYGIFITTSYFSREARKSSREGGTPVTLIDGEKLVDLMIQYKYKVKEVITFIPDDSYFGE